MSTPSGIAAVVAELREDLLAEGGPRISTMNTYRFAILVYDPRQEFELRRAVRGLTEELENRHGWNPISISLGELLHQRIEEEDPTLLATLIRTEKMLARKSPERALTYIKEKIAHLVEGEDGIVRQVIQRIDQLVDRHPEAVDRSLVLLGRAGTLYPFFRSSSLLKHLDGRTRGLPVVLLYPGERKDLTRLSFMGELPADGDYRPRIYGGPEKT